MTQGPKTRWLPLCGVAALLLAAPVAHADDDPLPLYLTLSQTFTRDSNLLKNDNNKQSDTISSTAVRAGLDKRYGRQHYMFSGTVAKNTFDRNDRFDNDSYAVHGEFVSDIGSSLRLTVNGDSSRSLSNFEDNVENRMQRNTVRYHRAGGDLRYGLYGRLSVNGGVNTSRVSYEHTSYDNKESQAAIVGVRYAPTDLLYFGVNYTKTETELPNRVLAIWRGDKVDRDNVSLVSAWRVTGFSQFVGSLGYTQERYEVDDRRDFDGVTGSATWNFTPPGKVRYAFNWMRDTNNEGGATLVGGLIFQSTNRLTNRFSAQAFWDATAKIQVSGEVTHASYREELDRDSLLPFLFPPLSTSGKGRYNSYGIGIDYQAMRSLALGCDVKAYKRTRSVFTYGYKGDTVSCRAAFTLD